MPSPLPGMDPYLEDPALWPEFRRRLTTILYEQLRETLDPGRYSIGVTSGGAAIEIRRTNETSLLTCVRVVDPEAKVDGPARLAYREQRQKVVQAPASYVEIDLLLQGQMAFEANLDGLPKWDYVVAVSRQGRPDRYDLYLATLPSRLPRFRVPLGPEDRDVVLDLAVAFTRSFDEGDYRRRIDYRREPGVPLSEEQRRWLDSTLVAKGLRPPLPPHEEIAVAAYYLWEQERRPHGRDLEHWLRALEILRHRQKADR